MVIDFCSAGAAHNVSVFGENRMRNAQKFRKNIFGFSLIGKKYSLSAAEISDSFIIYSLHT